MASTNVSDNATGEFKRPWLLVVEDEAFVRWVAASALREAGYHVIEAANGDEAAELIRAGVQIDLLFSDVRMPGELDGLTLLKFVQTAQPDVPVLITSGHTDPATMLGSGAFRFLRKPYKLDTLVGLVADALSCPK